MRVCLCLYVSVLVNVHVHVCVPFLRPVELRRPRFDAPPNTKVPQSTKAELVSRGSFSYALVSLFQLQRASILKTGRC
jgi:hypothetical protein